MVEAVARPAAVTRAVRLVWVLVLLAAAVTVLAVVLDDDILRSTAGTVSADDTRVPPSFTPVVIVLDVVVSSLVLVLLAFVQGGHNWARHCLAVSFVLLAVATAAVLRTAPPVEFVPPLAVWLALDGLLLYLLYRPETTAYVTPRVRVPSAPASSV
ncbi:hypothetical protein [Nocardioides sp.]|uniref:hypothetical protein n=1 Tax=Nocardioides sp. TaxID=35761 RepID=UPI0027158EAF|nr:hypothetical protein [Nocardioides sp.]MDO9454732.1 hypothetical protein [Nocardioides sp.]